MLAILGRLQRGVRDALPAAKSFVRPGLDEKRPPTAEADVGDSLFSLRKNLTQLQRSSGCKDSGTPDGL